MISPHLKTVQDIKKKIKMQEKCYDYLFIMDYTISISNMITLLQNDRSQSARALCTSLLNRNISW